MMTLAEIRKMVDAGEVQIIALTGQRHQGKSTAADQLESEYGFKRVHAFEGGKLMSQFLFEYITFSTDKAFQMVHGNLKETPSPDLPGNASPRDFMEKFGQFMGVQMGTAWTLEMEIARAIRKGYRKIVIESLIYEEGPINAVGGKIVRIEREGYEPPSVSSDATQALIKEHAKIVADSLPALHRCVAAFMVEWFGLLPSPRWKEHMERRFNETL